MERGYEVHRSRLTERDLEELRDEVDRLNSRRGVGVRDSLERSPIIAQQVGSAFGLSHLLPNSPEIVRCIVFDKSPETNWNVGWHQDLNLKSSDGEILERSKLTRVKTFRLHLDRTTAENGALRVLPGSHQHGPLSDSEKRALQIEEVLVEACPGDVLVMTPLLMHASSAMTSDSRRRVIHVDFL